MPALVDTNVWFPILLGRHDHHETARRWWESRGAGEAVWCRTAQLGVVRLLTNRTVMGADTMAPDTAWATWQRLAHDERCAFLAAEPTGVDGLMGKKVSGRSPSPKLWADAYLAALAEAAGLGMVTFDRDFRRLSAPPSLTLLESPPPRGAEA